VGVLPVLRRPHHVRALCFAYFYPIYVGETITYTDWYARMWLGNKWV